MTAGTRAGDGHATCPLLLQGELPVREDPSDETDEEASLAPQPPAAKPPGLPFRVKDDVDLFGLGPAETGPKASGGEGSRGPGRHLLTGCPHPVPLESGCRVAWGRKPSPGARFWPLPCPFSPGGPQRRFPEKPSPGVPPACSGPAVL